jgi:hypothetical protein
MGLLSIGGLLAAAVVCYVHRAIPRFTATAARHRRAWRAVADWLRIRHCHSTDGSPHRSSRNGSGLRVYGC